VTVLVGTSGWQYADWREPYYRGTPQRRWYEHLLADFRTTELNVTFYRLPKAETFAGWHDRSPADAVITVKASRYVTHVRRLRDTASSVALLLERSAPLQAKRGPVLLQLPPDLRVDTDALRTTLGWFPSGVRVAVEPRHSSWFVDEVRAVLERHDAALVWADRRGLLTPLWRTAGWVYVRFHEGTARRWPAYPTSALREWADRLAVECATDDGYVYFNNDPGCAAVDDAVRLGRMLAWRGVDVSRVPADRPAIPR
jgi:uncharacterized protein YecE (DUF72 family)